MGLLQISCMAHARAGQLAIPRFGGPNAQLAGDIFGCYLDGRMTTNVLSRIVSAVQAHSTHARIVAFIKERIEARQAQLLRKLSASELRDTAAQAVDDFRMEAPGPKGAGDGRMVKPYFSGDLQQIISGIHSIGLVDASYEDEAFTVVTGDYNIKDAYDFDNDRSMFPFYDAYRKRLAAYYVEDDANPLRLYSKLITTYEGDMLLADNSGGDAVHGPLNRPFIFTCFMYALEMGGCTKSLYWSANIPFTLELASPPSRGTAPDAPPVPVPDTPKPPKLPGAKPVHKMRSPRPVPPPPSAPGQQTSYTVQPGDTLSGIAVHIYGAASKWRAIYEANLSVIGSNPNLVRAGQTLVLPS